VHAKVSHSQASTPSFVLAVVTEAGMGSNNDNSWPWLSGNKARV